MPFNHLPGVLYYWVFLAELYASFFCFLKEGGREINHIQPRVQKRHPFPKHRAKLLSEPFLIRLSHGSRALYMND